MCFAGYMRENAYKKRQYSVNLGEGCWEIKAFRRIGQKGKGDKRTLGVSTSGVAKILARLHSNKSS